MNGILARVPGAYISAGAGKLPPPDRSQEGEPIRKVVLDVPELGAVRITYLLNQYGHGKNRFWHWLATHAERVGDEGQKTF